MNMSDMTKKLYPVTGMRGEDCKEARRRGKCIGQFGGGYFGGDL